MRIVHRVVNRVAEPECDLRDDMTVAQARFESLIFVARVDVFKRTLYSLEPLRDEPFAQIRERFRRTAIIALEHSQGSSTREKDRCLRICCSRTHCLLVP